MSSIQDYLRKANFNPRLSVDPDDQLKFIVVIPCHDEPDIEATLQSLELAAKAYPGAVEIIVVINDAAHHQPEILSRNKITFANLLVRKSDLPVHVIYESGTLSKKAGVGYARKIGMDEAVYRFDTKGKADGIVCSMDADTIVDPNYFAAIEGAYIQNHRPCKTIYYEHDINLTTGTEHFLAILHYELHLRYYINALRHAGFLQAFQTLGSALCIRANAYALMGGMPQRQAGEDFYFIHKFSVHDQVSEINNTVVRPSSRLSHRVPFGTGRAIDQALSHKSDLTLTYPLRAFEDLKAFLLLLPAIYEENQLPFQSLQESTQAFLKSIGFEQTIREIKANSSHYDRFRKRFFQKMDAFMMMKFIHYLRDQYYGMDDLVGASTSLFNQITQRDISNLDALSILKAYRNFDRGIEI